MRSLVLIAPIDRASREMHHLEDFAAQAQEFRAAPVARTFQFTGMICPIFPGRGVMITIRSLM